MQTAQSSWLEGNLPSSSYTGHSELSTESLSYEAFLRLHLLRQSSLCAMPNLPAKQGVDNVLDNGRL